MAKTATGARHSMAYIPEVTYGVTPATPAFQTLRHNGTSLGTSKTSLESAEIRTDRQVAHFRLGNRSVSGDIPIELSYTTFDDFLEAGLGGTWVVDTPAVGTDQLQAGILRRSFTIERLFGNLDIPEYHRYVGCEVNTISLSIAPDALITGSFSMVAKDQDVPATSIIAGATYLPATTTEPFDSFSGVINEAGVPIGVVTSLEFTLENGITPLFVVGSKVTTDPGIGKCRVTGTMTAYFQSAALLNKFLDETASNLQFTLVDPAGNSYDITFPNIKYTGGQPDVDGDGEISLPLPFVALYDVTEGSNITIERTPI